MIGMRKLVWRRRTSRCFATTPSLQYIGQSTAVEVIQTWSRIFYQSGVPEPELSAKHIISHVLNSHRIIGEQDKAHPWKMCSDEELVEICKLCSKRLKRMPVQYIIGEWDFRNTRLKLRPPVLIPRPETEDLVEYVLHHMRGEMESNDSSYSLQFLDVGCGSGAISISLLKELDQVNGVALDVLPKAVELTKENAILNHVSSRLEVVLSSIEDCIPLLLGSKFNHVISNPPYIAMDDMNSLQPEILQYESRVALDGGKDGLCIIRDILGISQHLLKPRGYLWLETGLDHELMSLVAANSQWNLAYCIHLSDFTGRLRFHKLQLIE